MLDPGTIAEDRTARTGRIGLPSGGGRLTRHLAETAGPCAIMWVVTNRCNLVCTHCYNDSRPDGPPVRDADATLRRRIAEEIAAIRPIFICMCGGEPAILPDFLDLCRTVAACGSMVNMVSNGWTLTRARIRQLREAGVSQVQVSLDGATAATHDAIRGAGSFDRVILALRDLKNEGFEHPAVAIVPNRVNFRELPRWLDLCRSLGIDTVQAMPLVPIGRAAQNIDHLALDRDEWLQVAWWFRRAELENPDMVIDWGDPMEHIYNYSNPGNPIRTFDAEIRADGALVVSSYLPLVVGHLGRHRLIDYWEAGYRDIWRHPRVQEWTRGLRALDDFSAQRPLPWTGEDVTFDLIEEP